MKKLLLALALLLAPASAFAQCTGNFPANTACGTVAGGFPGPIGFSLIGNGNVVGPASATDTAIALYNGTTGKLIENSLVTVDPTGAISVPASFVANTGRITVGSGGTLTSQNSAYQDQRTVTTSGTSLHGYAFDINLNASGGYGVGGFDCRFNVLGSQNYDHVNCFQSNFTYGSSGTLLNHISYLAQPHFTAGHVNAITGLFISNPDMQGAATADSNIGIFIDTQLAGGTTNFAIQTAGTTPSQFGGNVVSLTQFQVKNNTLAEMLLTDISSNPFSAWFSDGTNTTLKNYINGSIFLNIAGVNIGNATANSFSYAGAFASKIPTTLTGTSGSMAATDSSLIFNASGTFTITLLSASANPGRWLDIKSIVAQTINSASSNIVPLAGGAAGTALLVSGAGKWARLQSDGTNWVVMSGN